MRDLVLHLTDVAGPLRFAPYELVAVAAMLLFGSVVVFGFVLPVAGITSWLERRVWARMQSRVGPNRVGPQGFLQWLADGLKNLMKEDIIPSAADRRLFAIAPYLVVIGFVATFVVVPFGSALVIADLDIGILYITAVTGLVVVGVLMAGWASNNKWSLLGGIRSAAQIVSYEIPAGLSIFPVVLLAGTLSMQGIIRAQGWAPWQWFLFANPFTFVAFFLFFVAALAEGNRTPFDLPEAESELVAGFCTEYSGMRYLLFFLAEWGNLYVIGAIVTTLFLGGWQVPPLTARPAALAVLQLVTFFAKAYSFVLVAMWVRATLPRVRVDQLMTLCWKYMVPIALVNVVGTAIWMVVVPAAVDRVVAVAMTVGGAVLVLVFLRRVRFHLRRARLQPSDYYYSPFI
ncbi:MAG: NADH-quinone oxidoreductase subunit NuoH [Myxococcales bacterium]|jgi:NADH-quinone oxidoreductase subunit H|nr:NADH-quinone oxidoreductase subunit NuoH [Myxococcales bacterium]